MGLFDKLKKKPNTNEDQLLSIEKTDTIDGVAFDENNNKLVLLLADGMDWNNEYEHLILLQEKINNYIAYIEDKQYLLNYPNAEQVEVQIKFLYKETANCIKFLEQVKAVISEALENTTIVVESGTEE